jgi:hypothetical protein
VNLASSLSQWIRRSTEKPDEAFAHLLLAAREDRELRESLLVLLRAPRAQRQALIDEALEAMARRGETPGSRIAFAALATDAGAEAALRALESSFTTR